MRFTLLRFQEEVASRAVAALRLAMAEVGRVGASGSQAITLVAPTGAGKTVMAASILESLWWGDDYADGDDQLTVLWLSDLPNVNEQTRAKLAKASNKLTDEYFVVVDASFRSDSLGPQRLYFLNTQKLSSTSSLIDSSEDRSFTIWEIINRTIERDPSKVLLVIDEAHRGMDRAQAKTATDAQSITQRFILGSDKVQPIPIVLGISATPKRFDDLIAGTTRAIRRAEADLGEVRASGLIKERVIVWRPEHGLQDSEFTLLQRAAQNLLDYDIRWGSCAETDGKRINPILVVQVEDKTSDAITATDLEKCINAIETVTGPLNPDTYAHSFGDAPSQLNPGGIRTIRYINPSDIDGDAQVMVVFFKTSLSTGWDCPRAEVMMSFRTAHDATFIAQLVGRMVRTPLARRVESDEVLNSVALYLPKYDRGAVQAIIKQLRAGDPDVTPSIDAEDGEGLVVCERDDEVFTQLAAAVGRVPTFIVPRARRMHPVARLERLAGALSDFEVLPDAPSLADDALLDAVWQRLLARMGDPEFHNALEQIRTIGLDSTTLSYLTGETESELIRIQSTSQSIERAFEQAGRRTGAGLHEKLWRRLRNERTDIDGEEARLYVIATLGHSSTRTDLDTQASQLFDDWLSLHGVAIDQLPEVARQEIDELREHADQPTHRAWVLPQTLQSRRDAKSIDYPKSLFQDSAGMFPDLLNQWESEVLESELARDDVLSWLRNRSQQKWALTVPYESDKGSIHSMYPDFVFFRSDGRRISVDLVDPHGLHILDAPAKARGLAAYAQAHGSAFGRIEMVIYERASGRKKSLDLKKVVVRQQIAKVRSVEHLESLFDLAGA